MVSPYVSVILPFRDAEATLAEALATLRCQSLSDFECLLIDNESADRSASVAATVCRLDRRFTQLRQSGTLVAALNAGLAAARAPYLARMDADDLAHPKRLELQLALLVRDSSLSIASALVSSFAAGRLQDGMQRYTAWVNSLRTPEEIRNGLFIESPLPHPTVLMRREALAATRYREVDGPEDYDLWMRLLLLGHRAAKVPSILLRWRDSPRRLTRVGLQYRQRSILETKWRYFPQVVAPGTSIQICGAGRTGKRWAMALRARGYTIRRFVDVDLRKQGRSVCGAVVDDPSQLKPEDGFVLAAVGTPNAREQIETYLRQFGLRPWQDYLAVA